MKAGHLFSLFSTVQFKEETASNNFFFCFSYRIRIGGSLSGCYVTLTYNWQHSNWWWWCEWLDEDQDCDPRKKLRIVYSGEPAADTGGVIHQFYTQLLKVIADTFFQGDTYRSPVYNCDMVASGVMIYWSWWEQSSYTVCYREDPGFPYSARESTITWPKVN